MNVPTFELNNTQYGHHLDPGFVHVARVEILWLRFWTREPSDYFYQTGDQSPCLGAKDSRSTDQPERKTPMKRLVMKLARATRAQDTIEYALIAGFVAVASGAIMPSVSDSISTIFSKLDSVMTIASTQGN